MREKGVGEGVLDCVKIGSRQEVVVAPATGWCGPSSLTWLVWSSVHAVCAGRGRRVDSACGAGVSWGLGRGCMKSENGVGPQSLKVRPRWGANIGSSEGQQ